MGEVENKVIDMVTERSTGALQTCEEAIRVRLASKGARTGCVKKPSGKKLLACGEKLGLQGSAELTRERRLAGAYSWGRWNLTVQSKGGRRDGG